MIRDGVSPMGGFILPPQDDGYTRAHIRLGARCSRDYMPNDGYTRAHVRLRLSAVTGGRWLSDAPKGAVGEPWTSALEIRNRTS